MIAYTCHKPLTALDREVCRLALDDARRLVDDGYTADEAAAMATPGAWAPFRCWVREHLG